MRNTPLLSIVTPTRGSFSSHWFEQLCAVSGDVEFVLVYPPGVSKPSISAPRIRCIQSPFKGEVFQRFVGLLNASGTYIMALDDDDYVHPDVSQLVDSYFQNFPESWCLRLHVKKVDASHQDGLQASWAPIPDIHQLQTASRRGHDDLVLQEVPIAPLNNPFDIRFLIGPYVKRKDMQGPHIENFNNKVWKRELVHSTLNDIARVMTISYALTWIPQWSLDRMLGLFIQAKFFEKDKLMGHWMPMPEQIRYVCMDQSEKGEFRLILPADALLVKKFPQYGYFWNLFFEQFWVAIKKVSRKCLDDMRSWIAQK